MLGFCFVFFLSPCYLAIGSEEFYSAPSTFSPRYLFHIFIMYCIRVRHRRRGSGAFWVSIAICNIDFVVIEKFI